jgi:hypothetical protein
MIKTEISKVVLVPIKDEISFEIVQALTHTARDAAAAIKREMPKKFILRRDWAVKGVRFDAARMSNPIARVFSVDPWMNKQEEGENYTPSGGHVAIPAGVRRSPKDQIPLGMFPRMLRGRDDVFKVERPGKIGWGIFQKDKQGEIKLLYFLRPKKTTKPRWEFSDRVEKTVELKFFQNLA